MMHKVDKDNTVIQEPMKKIRAVHLYISEFAYSLFVGTFIKIMVDVIVE